MKRWHTPSPRPPRPSRAWRRTRPLPPAARAVAALTALAASACVSSGAHREVVDERDALKVENASLSERVAMLERSNENLDTERIALIEETEELRDAREGLERAVSRLEEKEAELSANLAVTTQRLSAQEQEVGRLRGTYEGLVADLESEVAAGQIEIEQLREGIRLNVSDEILFAVGSAELGPEGEAVLRKVSGQIRNLDQRVEVQGHSDNAPIKGGLSSRYPSNWELAGARAASVVRLFQEQGLDGERLTAVSFAEFRPVASNETPEDRALNRRIEIRLLPVEPGDARLADGEPGSGRLADSEPGTGTLADSEPAAAAARDATPAAAPQGEPPAASASSSP